MGWFSSVWHAVTHPSQLISDGEHWLGQVTDQGAHLVGRGLTDIGLGQLGNTVDGWGDDAANALDHELELGQTSDPTQLIHGDPGTIRKTSSQLSTFSDAFGQTATGLAGIDTTHWTGQASEAFHAKYSPQPARWSTASDATASASDALGFYADTVEWAQGQAKEAIALWADGEKATSAAVSAYNGQVNAYNAQAQAYDTQLAAGQNPGPPPVKPGPFTDPGESLRQRAQAILTAARQARNREGSTAAQVVSKATNSAPASPGLWSQVGNTLTDGVQFTNLAQASFDSGVLTGVADIGKFARTLNPTDPWNMTHPAEYLAGLSGTAAGLVHDAVHPQDLVGQVLGGGWGSDPFQAAGKLVPQVALALATDGGGAAADGAGDVATQAARSAEDVPKVGDPVDVATGDVIMPQVDVRLAARPPLVVGRVHRSSYRGGRWFGRSWASTLDQRLVVTGKAVVFAAEDGMVLCYPRPGDGGSAVLPVTGARWALARDGDGYTVTDPQAGVVRKFAPRSGFYLSAAGEGELPLVSVSDRAGHQVRFGYTPDGAPQSLTHDGGCHLKVMVTGGRVAGLALAGAGPDGQDVPLVRYGYDAAGDLAEVFNSSGIPLRFSYDQAGRITGWEDRNGCCYQYHYDDYGRCVRGEGPDGSLSGTFGYDREAMVTTHTDAAGVVTRYQVTPGGQVAAVTDPLGNVTQFEHDRYGRLVARSDALGRVTTWSYDGAGNLAGVTRPDGSRAVAVYDERNLALAMTGPDGATWHQDYDESGNLVRRTGPDGAVTCYSYDGRGHLAGVTSPDGATVRVECDAAGLPVSVTGADESQTSYERDGFGRVVTATGPRGEVMRLEWTVEGLPLSRKFPDGEAERYAYDGEGNLTGHMDPARGVTRFEYGGFGQMLARVWPDGTRTSFGYDQALRLTSVSHGGMTWRYEHDLAGRLVAETDYNGAVTRYTRDAAGQLSSRMNAVGQEVSFGYDQLGNLAERIAEGAVTRFVYDSAARLAGARNPDTEIEFERDAAGRVIAEICDGRTVRSAYDPAGRRVLRVTPSGAQARWDYDSAGRPAALHSAGQELRFGYDHAGRETTRDLPGALRLSQQWDDAGRLAAQTLSAARNAPAAGRSLISPAFPPAPAGSGQLLQRRSYSYRADGCVTGLEDLLSGPRRLTLDPAGRVTAVAGPDWTEQYSYDPVGNLVAGAWPVPPGEAEDWLGADAQGPREYAGTLITRAGGVRYQHDAQGRITMRQRVRDSRKPDTWRYDWDAEDRLTAVTTPDGTNWRYIYDPLGRRIAKQRLGPDDSVREQVSFTWDGAVLAEQDSDGRGAALAQIITWDYTPGTFTPVTQVTRPAAAAHPSWPDASQDQVDAQFYAIVTDLIGAPSELTAPDGTLAGYQQHTLWGATLWHPGGATTPLRFPGQYADDETGLHYNQQRYYDPITGSYLSPDPLGLAPGPNPHAYVVNPQVLTDPLGLEPVGPTGKSVFMEPNDPFAVRNQLTDPLPGFHDVVIHGNASMFARTPTGAALNAGDLADLIKNDPTYAGGPIRLISCSSGKLVGGPAQQLADRLGVPVMAADDTVSIGPDGSLTVGQTPGMPTGNWVTFQPKPAVPPPSFGSVEPPTVPIRVVPPSGGG